MQSDPHRRADTSALPAIVLVLIAATVLLAGKTVSDLRTLAMERRAGAQPHRP